MKGLWCALFPLFSNVAVAQEALEEASGLEDAPAETPAPPVAPKRFFEFKHRAYFLSEGVWTKLESNEWARSVPNFELGLTGSLDTTTQTTFFADITARFDELSDKTTAGIEQIGLRQGIGDSVVVAFGKERNRRAPGLVFSPSDFIYTLDALPGQRETRTGVWLGRISTNFGGVTFEFFQLGKVEENQRNLPKKVERGMSVARLYTDVGPADIGVSVGKDEEVIRSGLHLQAIFKNALRSYYEFGGRTEEDATITQHLFGFGYEGIDKFSVRAEYLHNGAGVAENKAKRLPVVMNPFLLKRYIILSTTVSEIKDRFNVFLSPVYSVDDKGALLISRAEWLATGSQVVGLGIMHKQSEEGSVFSKIPLKQQYSVDWKWTF